MQVSEGINFADAHARAVVVLGVPYPSLKDAKVMLKKQHARDFQVSRMAWIGDYADPLTFLDLFESAFDGG